jgi:hypothetical protein
MAIRAANQPPEECGTLTRDSIASDAEKTNGTATEIFRSFFIARFPLLFVKSICTKETHEACFCRDSYNGPYSSHKLICARIKAVSTATGGLCICDAISTYTPPVLAASSP